MNGTVFCRNLFCNFLDFLQRSLSESCEPGQQFSELVWIDQKIKSGRHWGENENPIPHGRRSAKLRPRRTVYPNPQISINAYASNS
jgi:hypothetical protein